MNSWLMLRRCSDTKCSESWGVKILDGGGEGEIKDTGEDGISYSGVLPGRRGWPFIAKVWARPASEHGGVIDDPPLGCSCATHGNNKKRGREAVLRGRSERAF